MERKSQACCTSWKILCFVNNCGTSWADWIGTLRCESTIRKIHTPVYGLMYHEDISTLANRNVNWWWCDLADIILMIKNSLQLKKTISIGWLVCATDIQSHAGIFLQQRFLLIYRVIITGMFQIYYVHILKMFKLLRIAAIRKHIQLVFSSSPVSSVMKKLAETYFNHKFFSYM
jgi:hypothetical protein